MKKRIETLEKINGLRGGQAWNVNDLSSLNSYEKESQRVPPKRKQYEDENEVSYNEIEEADEQLEATG